jgi:hypothetical protein
MPAPLYAHIRQTSTEKLLIVLEFFTAPTLSQYYVGLIGDLRRELAERGVDVSDAQECAEELDFLEDLRKSIKEGLAGDVISEEQSLARVRSIVAAKARANKARVIVAHARAKTRDVMRRDRIAKWLSETAGARENASMVWLIDGIPCTRYQYIAQLLMNLEGGA